MQIDTDATVLLFLSTSGHCNLTCPYCIIHPVPKREASLTGDDLEWLLDRFPGEKAFLMVSGKGDFFAGYEPPERLLDRLLARDVEMILDVNGVVIREYPELSAAQRRKIRILKLTLHYQQVKRLGALEAWAENARVLAAGTEGSMIVDTVVSPRVRTLWTEALEFYQREIFEPTGRRIVLVRDIETPLGAEGEAELARLRERFDFMIDSIYTEDFAAPFEHYPHVICPAGRRYFRVWNDGRIEGCPWIPELTHGGNVKERRLSARTEDYRCATPKYCDCERIAQVGCMGYPDRVAPGGGSR